MPDSERERAGPRGRPPAGAFVLVVVLAVVPHLPSLANGYALDDVWQVETNEAVHGLDNVAALLVSPYAVGMNPLRSPYRPVTTVTYALDWTLGGGSPLVFHVTNVVLHAAATVAVLVLLWALGAPVALATMGGALFAVHPVHVEAVANVVGRADVLATLFVLLGVLAYLSPWRRVTRSVAVGAAYLLALGSKEIAVTLPALLVLVEVARGPGDRGGLSGHLLSRLRREAWVFAGLGAVLATYLGMRLAVLGMLGTYDVAPYIAALPTGARVSTAVANLAEVARLLVFPADLSADYGPAVLLPAGPGDLRFWVGGVVGVGGLVLGAVALHRRAGLAGAGLLWVAVALLPIANLLLPVPIWIAERTLYLASVGGVVAVVGVGTVMWRPGAEEPGHGGVGGEALGARLTPTVVAIVGGLVILGGLHSWTRSASWRDTDAILTTLAAEHPESFRARWWVAGRLVEAGEVDRGLELMEEAVALNSNDAFIRLDQVRLLLVVGRPAEAEARLREIPEGMSPSWYAYLVQSLADRGRMEEARDAVRRGLERFPGNDMLSGQAAALGVTIPPTR